MDLELVINIGVAIVAWIAALLNMIVEKNKTKKAKKIVNLAKVVQKIPAHIKEAEQLIGDGNGEKKLAVVMEKIKIDCLELSVNYEDNLEGLTQEVEKILDTPQKKQNEETTSIRQQVTQEQNELLLKENELLQEKIKKLKGE